MTKKLYTINMSEKVNLMVENVPLNRMKGEKRSERSSI